MKSILWGVFFLFFSLFVVFLVLQTWEKEKVKVRPPHAPDHQHGALHNNPHIQEISNEVSSSATAKEAEKNYLPRFSHGVIQKAFAKAIALRDTNFGLAQEEIHAVAVALGDGDPYNGPQYSGQELSKI